LSESGNSGGGEGSGPRENAGSRVTIFTVAPQILVTAVSTASTATANLLQSFQKKRKKKRSVMSSEENHGAMEMSSMEAKQEQQSAQEQGKLKISFYY
jgi:pyruvate/2-oxoglutarate dehydrogenase complex dihydrolipoamide dehydrogenase (E3) component